MFCRKEDRDLHHLQRRSNIPPHSPLSFYEVLQVMSLMVVKAVLKALLKVVEVLKVVQALSPPSHIPFTCSVRRGFIVRRVDDRVLTKSSCEKQILKRFL